MCEEPAMTSRAWAVVLAGGNGIRLRSLIRDVFGDDRPKQFAPLVTDVSLLRQTLDRTGCLISPNRTVVVSCEHQSGWVARDVGPESRLKVLLQPENRETAAAVLLGVYWVASRDPDATIVLFPSDHFILEEGAFLAHVNEVIDFVEHHPGWVVLLGAPATAPEIDYGWIEPGEAVGATATGPITRVERFREKPTPRVAAACLARGWLWNTFVFVAKAATLGCLAEVLLPEVHHRLNAVAPFFGSRREAYALQVAYAGLPRSNFSHVVLQTGFPCLGVSMLPPLTWSDVGTPQRLFTLLRALRFAPAWMRGRTSATTRGHGWAR